MQQHTENELKEIATQLRCPKGKRGLDMGNKMYRTNTDMLLKSLVYLNIERNNRILEIGHGNCAHLPHIISQAEDIKYFGLEISKLMKQEAERINQKYTRLAQAEYLYYDGNTLPFSSNFFDRIITVNTLYFFENPQETMNQVAKVLKPNGIFALTFQQKEFIKDLPFIKYGFNIFDIEEVTKMLKSSGLTPTEIIKKTEKTTSKLGDEVFRKYVIIQSQKIK